jgi:hypothetical protein
VQVHAAAGMVRNHLQAVAERGASCVPDTST